jgi:hypothetical protein
MDESAHEGRLQSLARHFRVNGARWGHFRNLAEVPLFVDSRASRCVQIADLIAWATWRRYEHQDGRFFDQLIPKFDADGGIIHGLVHHGPRNEPCYCLAAIRGGAVMANLWQLFHIDPAERTNRLRSQKPRLWARRSVMVG